eukprot:161704-Chlamydomonas_euryale.AAC.8
MMMIDFTTEHARYRKACWYATPTCLGTTGSRIVLRDPAKHHGAALGGLLYMFLKPVRRGLEPSRGRTSMSLDRPLDKDVFELDPRESGARRRAGMAWVGMAWAAVAARVGVLTPREDLPHWRGADASVVRKAAPNEDARVPPPLPPLFPRRDSTPPQHATAPLR